MLRCRWRDAFSTRFIRCFNILRSAVLYFPRLKKKKKKTRVIIIRVTSGDIRLLENVDYYCYKSDSLSEDIYASKPMRNQSRLNEMQCSGSIEYFAGKYI